MTDKTPATQNTPVTDPTAPQRHKRLRRQPRQVLLLTAVWLVLVGEISVVTVVGGLLLSLLVTIVFPLPPIEWAGNLRPWGAIRLLAHLLKDLATASVRLGLFAFSRRQPVSGIIRVDLAADNDLYQVNTAELVSVVPGTIVVDARRRSRRLYLHVFDLPHPALRGEVVKDTHALERRVLGALGSRAEIEALDYPKNREDPRFEEVT